MNRTRPRRAAALLLAAAFLVAATPPAAAPATRGAGEARSAPSLLDALSAWLAALWPGAAPGGAPAAGWSTVGAGGEPTPEPQLGSELDPYGGLTPEPQLGSVGDPDG
ncbi:MAG TPA: hypothetical protein VM599_01400 [Thermoanaerobaculia bacterium]|nr:hypothetical protein [Thermoanaerobaculia bacterium]